MYFGNLNITFHICNVGLTFLKQTISESKLVKFNIQQSLLCYFMLLKGYTRVCTHSL
jgi:hypothetical protein